MRYLILTYVCLFALQAMAQQSTAPNGTTIGTGSGPTGIKSIDLAVSKATAVGKSVLTTTTTQAPPDSDPTETQSTSKSRGTSTLTYSNSNTSTSKSTTASPDSAYQAQLDKIDKEYQAALNKANTGTSTASTTPDTSSTPKDDLALGTEACIKCCRESSPNKAEEGNCDLGCATLVASLLSGRTVGTSDGAARCEAFVADSMPTVGAKRASGGGNSGGGLNPLILQLLVGNGNGTESSP